MTYMATYVNKLFKLIPPCGGLGYLVCSSIAWPSHPGNAVRTPVTERTDGLRRGEGLEGSVVAIVLCPARLIVWGV
jgi:hypothetical protein